MTRVVLAALLLTAPIRPGEHTPAQSAQAFYQTYQRTGMSGLPRSRQFQQHLSEGLRRELADARAKQNACQAAHPGDKPMWAEGDLFTSNLEGFTRVAVRPGAATGAVVAEFEYVEGAVRVVWSDEIVLKRERGRWVIDDVRYGRQPAMTLRAALAAPGC